MAAKDSVTQQLRSMANTPYEGLQAAILSDVVDNQEELVSAVREMSGNLTKFITAQSKINESHEAGILENKALSKENAKAITDVKIKDAKGVALIAGGAGALVKVLDLVWGFIVN